MKLRLVLLALLVTTSVAQAAGVDPALLGGLQWRLIGPFRGGRVLAVSGVRGEPQHFYFGSVDGGVWETRDAGRTWQPIFDAQHVGSIGALAVAPSDPKVIYVGTGEADMRSDIAYGDGVYRSVDGGRHWTNVGLRDTYQIGKVLVDPANPDIIFVAALGHAYGPNEMRGVFRSKDGGATWQKVLYKDASTGAIDLAFGGDGKTIYASLWQTRRPPWNVYPPSNGPGSGVYKSTDGGDTWNEITANGIDSEGLGHVGLAVAPSNPDVVYALADAKHGGLYRSDDAGAHFTRVTSDKRIWNRGWYFGGVSVDPKDPNEVYVCDTAMYRSTDGGKDFQPFLGDPTGDDFHSLWIDPHDGKRMIAGVDQGTIISVNGGDTWTSWFNQPTGQFYHVATDDRFPYHIYSGQQDSGTVETESASDFGEISFRDWHPAGGDERSYVVPDPKDPAIVYVGGLGGHISRYDDRTHQVQNISATPMAGYARQPTTVKDRYTWFYPVVTDPHKGGALYVGSQYLYKTSDGGMHWKAISGDLTGPDPAKASGCDGNTSFTLEQARYCGFGAIFSIAPSPRKDGVIWVGTDDGLVQLTRDGGKHWREVTPKGMPFYGRVNQVEASPTDPATAYVAVDIHRQDKFQPFIFRTHDYGATWEAIIDGIPADQFVYVVRQDPKDAHLLYAGTNAGVYVSFDDGGRWQPLQGGLPNVRVRDLVVHGDDLIAATHGRGLWVLDDVAPLRHLQASVAGESAHLFTPATAVRVRRNENKDTPLPPEVSAAPNPPEGAILDYWVGTGVQGPVQLEIYDAKGKLVSRFSSDAPAPALKTDQYFTDAWLAAPEKLDGTPGAHRFVWDLRYPRPPSISYDYSIAAVYRQGGALLPEGPLVLPGTYTIKFTAGGKTQTASLKVVQDPRMDTREVKQALPKQLAFLNQIGTAMDRSYADHAAVSRLRDALKPLKTDSDTALIAAATDLDAKAEQLESKAPKHGNFDNINGGFSTLATEAGDGDRAPPQQYLDSYGDYMKYLASAEQAWRTLQAGDLARFNAMLKAKGRAVIPVSAP